VEYYEGNVVLGVKWCLAINLVSLRQNLFGGLDT